MERATALLGKVYLPEDSAESAVLYGCVCNFGWYKKGLGFRVEGLGLRV